MSTLRCFCRWGEKKTRKLRTFALRVDRRATEAKFPKAARPAASNRKNQQQRLKRQNPNEIAELNSTLDLDSGLCSLLNPSPPHKSTREILRCESIWGAECLRFLGCCVQATHHLPHFWRSWRASSIWFWFYFILASFRLFIYSSRFRLGVCLQSGGGRGESHARQAFSISHRCLESLGVVTKRSGPLLLRIRIGYA